MLRELFDDWNNDAIWSELSQDFIGSEQKKKKNPDPTLCLKNENPELSLQAFLCVPCHSKLPHPAHVNQNYTTSTGLSPGVRSSPRLPLLNSLFMPRHNVSG